MSAGREYALTQTRFFGAWIYWILSTLVGILLAGIAAAVAVSVSGAELPRRDLALGGAALAAFVSLLAYGRAFNRVVRPQVDAQPVPALSPKFVGGWMMFVFALCFFVGVVVAAIYFGMPREHLVQLLQTIPAWTAPVLPLFVSFFAFRWSVKKCVLSPMFPEGGESSFVPQAGAASVPGKTPAAKVPRPFFAAWFAWTICALAVGAGLLFGADRFLAVPPDSPAEKLLLALVWIAATFPFYRWTLNRFARPVLFPDPALFPDAARPPFAKSAKGWGMCALVCIPANLALGELKWGVFGRFGETAVADAVVAAAALMISFAAFKWSAKKFVFAFPSPPPELSQPPEEPQ